MAQRESQGGSILIFLLASVMVLAGAILALLTIEQGRANRARTEIERTRAFTIAESGIDQVAVLMSSNAWVPGSTLDWSKDGIDNDGDGLADEGDESLTATVQTWWTDGLDNDGDGLRDESDEWVARVACTVPLGISTVTLTGWIQRLESIIPFGVPAVLTLLDPNADLNFSGNSFRINGNDQNLDGTPGSSSPVYGIAIDGTLRNVLTQLTGQQLDNVIGTGGWPSVTTWTPPSPTWFPNLVEFLKARAQVKFTNFTGTYNGTLGNAQTGNYLITHSQGSLNVGGGATGAGILVVEGDLVVGGGFSYTGLVIVTGQIRVTGGGSGQTLKGAVIVGGDVNQSRLSANTLTGSIDLAYSAEALNRVRLALTQWGIAAVTEP